ncbi:hypothetical protein, partial [Streptomyces celluloflavus]
MIVEPGRADVHRWQNSADMPLKCGDGSQDPSQTPFPAARGGGGGGGGRAGAAWRQAPDLVHAAIDEIA